MSGRLQKILRLIPLLLLAWGSARGAPPPTAALQRPDGVLESIDSEYNSIIVRKAGPRISLTFGYRNLRYTESAIDWSRPEELVVPYTRYMTVALAYCPDTPKRIGMVGLGGGRTISYLTRALPEARAEVAELDPAVIDVAGRYFGVVETPNLRIHAQDGRVYLAESRQQFDLILLDAYRGPFVPFHLTTKEFYQLVKSRLREGGVVAQNVDPDTLLLDSTYLTMKAVFAQVDAYYLDENIVLIGYSGRMLPDEELAAAAARVQARGQFRHDLRELVKARFLLEVNGSARPLTDDFAPVEVLRTIKRHNEKRQ